MNKNSSWITKNMGSSHIALYATALLVFLIGIIYGGLSAQGAWAKEVPFTLEDRDRLIRIEAKMEAKFEEIDKRFEQIDKRFADMMGFMWMLASVFGGIVVVTIGFAIWDRRTMVRPFEKKIRGLEEDKVDKLVSSLRELAKTEVRVEDVLRKFNLL